MRSKSSYSDSVKASQQIERGEVIALRSGNERLERDLKNAKAAETRNRSNPLFRRVGLDENAPEWVASMRSRKRFDWKRRRDRLRRRIWAFPKQVGDPDEASWQKAAISNHRRLKQNCSGPPSVHLMHAF
jgi:hypothetical protein